MKHLLLVVASAALAGCAALGLSVSGASPAAIPLVRAHAETDLDCPGTDIRIEQQLGGVYEAVGCGHKAVYSTACDGLQCVVREGNKAIPWHDWPSPQPGSSPLPSPPP